MSPLFDVSGVVFAYPRAGFRALDGVDMQLFPGERLCLTGANGAGKSTLLQIMVGLLKPQAGTVTAFGRQPAGEAEFREVRIRAGYVFQDPDDQLFCPTVAEDVAFGPLNCGKSRAETREIVDATLARLKLSAFRDRITYKLSGGERRLVSLATVLAMSPDVLLLDEPTNALDEATTERLVEILRGLPQAMVIVSHDPHFREAVGTRTVRLAGGRCSAVGPGDLHRHLPEAALAAE